MAKTYLKKAGLKFKYQRRVPARFKDYFKQKTIIRSINTTSKIDAAYFASRLNVDIQKIFDDLDRELEHVDRNANVKVLLSINDEITTLTQDKDKAPSTVLRPHVPAFKNVPIPNQYDPLGVVPKIKLPSDKTLQDLIESFIKEQTRRNVWREASAKENANMFKLLSEFVGDIKLIHFDRQVAKDVRDFIHNLPKDRNKKKDYRELSVKQISIMLVPEKDVISDRSKDKYINAYISLFNYALEEEEFSQSLVSNIFRKLTIGKRNFKNAESFIPFNDGELFSIFNSEKSIYKLGGYTPSRFFVPLLVLTGMGRVQEYTQLTKDQIIQKNKIWCVNHISQGDKTLKSENSPRVTAIHSKVLKDYGFLNYVKALDDGAPLFPELKWNRGKNFQAVSSWFNNVYLKNLGIKAQRKVLYSLKATGLTLLDNKGVSELILAQICGHKYGAVEATRTYSAGKNIAIIRDAIEEIDFECLAEIAPFSL